MRSDDVSPWLIRGVYLFGFALVLHAVIDLSTTVWPLRVTEITWRYGFLGLAAGYLQTPTLGLLLIAATALWTGNLALARTIGTLLMVVSVGLIAAVGIFMLDVVQIRQLRPAEAQAAVLYGGLFQAVKYVLASALLAAMGYGLRDSAQTAARGVPIPPERGPLIGAKAEKPVARTPVKASDSDSTPFEDEDIPVAEDASDDDSHGDAAVDGEAEFDEVTHDDSVGDAEDAVEDDSDNGSDQTSRKKSRKKSKK